jgi:YspA, cpYpsA-related SLOG family
MKVIVAGTRKFNDYPLLCRKCDYYLQDQNEIEIVSGCATGADKLGEKYAKERGFKVKQFPADWAGLGKKAGYERNKQMAEYAECLLVFWDGASLGTKHMIDLARQNGLEVRIIQY